MAHFCMKVDDIKHVISFVHCLLGVPNTPSGSKFVSDSQFDNSDCDIQLLIKIFVCRHLLWIMVSRKSTSGSDETETVFKRVLIYLSCE